MEMLFLMNNQLLRQFLPKLAADAGPNKIQEPSAEAIKLVVKENIPIDLLATR